ncbi:MAG TPA: hypothetical protein VFR24_03420 [Candidatus Angelobacter sp.]|nr:hypothetical protein [Candidatus Angelobacter sp.]
MLAEDCKQFLGFVQTRDPVVVVDWISESPRLDEVQKPWARGGWYCLWNQALLPNLERMFIPTSDRGPYYRVDSVLPVIEFSYPNPHQDLWNARLALTQGRVWAGFERQNKNFEQWYNAVVRWIRKNFIRIPIPLDGYVGPEAYEWFKKGGNFLPILRPPITPQWLAWVDAQNQIRNLLAK